MKKLSISLITAAAVIVIGILAPQRLTSQYASPVNVMNSKAAPAQIRDTDNPRRTPYMSAVNAGTCKPDCIFTAVPANMRLVITHFDAWASQLNSDPAGRLAYIALGQTTFTTSLAFPEFTSDSVTAGANTINIYRSSRAVEYYLDAGSAPRVDFAGMNAFINPAEGDVTLTGYLIDCTTGCSPVMY